MGKISTLGLEPSFGFGDRLGLATPGHIAAMKDHPWIQPIFAQQSIREMTRTARSPEDVMQDALKAGWQGKQGADADHLKTKEDVDRTSAAGFVFFTIDPSDYVDAKADTYSPSELHERRGDDVKWVDAYCDKSLRLPTGMKLEIDNLSCARAAVKYGTAVNHAIELGKYIASVSEKAGREYEIELSVDETSQPTTLAEHFIVADRCKASGINLVSLAPRFIGDFEKGVDYKGDVEAFERSLEDHAAIAEMVGPYKLSLHSGSDKLSIYPAFARATRGRFHVKTAGTSYLEALRVIARGAPELFRRIVDFAREKYETDRATYHVSADLKTTPAAAAIKSNIELEQIYLERWEDVKEFRGFTAPGRQILHTTYGSVLKFPDLRSEFFAVLKDHQAEYRDILKTHFKKHLDALEQGMK